jgi:hypothetical protein
MQQQSQYARIERERRFPLKRLPYGIKVTGVRRLTDRYINGTALRLRVQHEDNGPTVFKLTQKVPAPGNGAQQGLITSMYLTEEEFAVIAQLPARMLSKIRVGSDEKLQRFAGHLGYTVEENARGRRLASRAIRLLAPLAKRHGLTELWITCSPEKAASRRTCELAGGVLVETVDLPAESDMYARGERRKCRYRIDLRSAGWGS